MVRTNRDLQLRQAILADWCDMFSLIQYRMAVHCEDVDAVQFRTLLQKEVELLQELSGNAGGVLPHPGDLAALVQPEADTVAPCTDPLAYLRDLVSRPYFEGAETMTAQEYAAFMQKVVVRVSMKLHQLEGLPPQLRPAKIKELADAWDRWEVNAIIISCPPLFLTNHRL